jgi:DNA recombination protein RmuC
MEPISPLIVVVLLVLFAILGSQVYVLFFRKEKKAETQDGMLLMQQQLQELSRTMREQMSESNRVVQQGSQMQFRESKELIQQINKDVNEQIRSIQESVSEKLLHVQKGVTEVSESSKQVFTLAEQLQSLEKVLKHQKQRGNLGEASLHLALENILPATSYKLQYQFEGRLLMQSSLPKTG